MLNWLADIPNTQPIGYSVIIFSLVAASGLALGSIRVRGFSLGIAGALFTGLIFAHFGFNLEPLGIPEEQLRRAARSAVCKINIDSDGCLAMTAVLRKIFAENPGEFEPCKYLGPARDQLIKMVRYKNEQVLMSAGKA